MVASVERRRGTGSLLSGLQCGRKPLGHSMLWGFVTSGLGIGPRFRRKIDQGRIAIDQGRIAAAATFFGMNPGGNRPASVVVPQQIAYPPTCAVLTDHHSMPGPGHGKSVSGAST